MPNDDPRWDTVMDNFLSYLKDNKDVVVGGLYWAGGPRWLRDPKAPTKDCDLYCILANNLLTNRLDIEPTDSRNNDFTADKPQMTVLQKHLGTSPLQKNGRIGFSSNRDSSVEVYTMNQDGTGLTNLTNNAANDYDPAFSPDGKQIAFESDRDHNPEIYVMNADGTGLTNLTNNAGDDYGPAFSPDGKKIAFESHRDGDKEVYVMNADGTEPLNLTQSPASDEGLPSWSPDGARIAFSSNLNGKNSEVYAMNVYELNVPENDGQWYTNLTQNQADDDYPSWSPDGTKIAFGRNRGSNSDIYTMNAGGTGQTNLTNNPAFYHGTAWAVKTANQQPVANDDSYNTKQDQPLNLSASSGVLANDSDPDGDLLTAAKASPPTHGTLTLNSDGSFTYTPNSGFSGTDTFTYKANDGQADSNVATVTITVNSVPGGGDGTGGGGGGHQHKKGHHHKGHRHKHH